jgi:hypothetical protein
MIDNGRFNQSREDDAERAAEMEIAREHDPDFDGPVVAPNDFDEYADFDSAEFDEPTPRALTEREQYESDRDDDRAADAQFEADREADYEYELACRASGKAA